jgi:hypothetical protein
VNEEIERKENESMNASKVNSEKKESSQMSERVKFKSD